MRLNFIEMVVVVVILASCALSMADSFISFVAPMSVKEQRVAMEPTLEIFNAYGLGEGGRE
ncbi:MAG: hypothetical protein PHN84_12815 [Desulfuromonadaceae bacterium]|nr:hypothetical protein [Desulfuromonadaceae bacterium]MDD2856476.1 hypothetical protein [Desulfuromonadaceae bacterium]